MNIFPCWKRPFASAWNASALDEGDRMKKKRKRFSPRLIIQLAYTALTNGYIAGFAHGKIYQGPAKQVCLPGLNCYSCPGALGSCPIGSLQAVLASRDYSFSFYVLGFLMAVGALCGRLVCGFLCPFGLAQDLLHKIPLPRKWKIRRIPGEKIMGHFRYVIVLVFVILLPSLVVNGVGQGDPWFCKYICPSGTLMGGIPLVALSDGSLEGESTIQLQPAQPASAGSLGLSLTAQPNISSGPLLGNPSGAQGGGGAVQSLTSSYREAAGPLFNWKLTVLLLIAAFSIVYYRPFCRFLCPLGAIYGLANPISIYRYRLLEDRCTKCGACKRACKLGIDPMKHPNSPECIRCGECIRACPHKALLPSMSLKRQKKSGGCSGNCKACSSCSKKA